MSKGSRNRTTDLAAYGRGYDGVRWPRRSTCCDALVVVCSAGGITHWYECSKCGQPCAVVKGGDK